MAFIATLGIVAQLWGGPVPFAAPAELGGEVVISGDALPSVVPVTVRLYDGALPVATAQADLFGRFALQAPPGDYWLQVKLGEVEAHVEQVQLKEGSWTRQLDVPPPWKDAERSLVDITVRQRSTAKS
jgi:hypothetical protein